jgi:hypothetical protein
MWVCGCALCSNRVKERVEGRVEERMEEWGKKKWRKERKRLPSNNNYPINTIHMSCMENKDPHRCQKAGWE